MSDTNVYLNYRGRPYVPHRTESPEQTIRRMRRHVTPPVPKPRPPRRSPSPPRRSPSPGGAAAAASGRTSPTQKLRTQIAEFRKSVPGITDAEIRGSLKESGYSDGQINKAMGNPRGRSRSPSPTRPRTPSPTHPSLEGFVKTPLTQVYRDQRTLFPDAQQGVHYFSYLGFNTPQEVIFNLLYSGGPARGMGIFPNVPLIARYDPDIHIYGDSLDPFPILIRFPKDHKTLAALKKKLPPYIKDLGGPLPNDADVFIMFQSRDTLTGGQNLTFRPHYWAYPHTPAQGPAIGFQAHAFLAKSHDQVHNLGTVGYSIHDGVASPPQPAIPEVFQARRINRSFLVKNNG